MSLIKEDGSAKIDSNTYASVEDADTYFEGHLYADAWTGASEGQKGSALIFATRLIDSLFQFRGWRVSDTQALQWPRQECPDPDRSSANQVSFLVNPSGFVSALIVPKPILQATCEMARELLIQDRTAAVPGEGIALYASHDAEGGSSTTYSKSDSRPILSRVTQAMLLKYGVPSTLNPAVPLIRT